MRRPRSWNWPSKPSRKTRPILVLPSRGPWWRSYLHRSTGEQGPIEDLTARQREVLQLIAEGKNTKEVAGMLEIGVKTVEAHRLQLMARLDIHDVPGLIRYAVRSRIVEP
jgi:DNA-binding CsgD family transcriptional regulator